MCGEHFCKTKVNQCEATYVQEKRKTRRVGTASRKEALIYESEFDSIFSGMGNRDSSYCGSTQVPKVGNWLCYLRSLRFGSVHCHCATGYILGAS